MENLTKEMQNLTHSFSVIIIFTSTNKNKKHRRKVKDNDNVKPYLIKRSKYFLLKVEIPY